MYPLLKLDDSVDVEEVTADVPDNYLLCICENGENLKDRKKGDILIGIMVSQFHRGSSILGFMLTLFGRLFHCCGCYVGFVCFETSGYILI